jgi:hypothetical protein
MDLSKLLPAAITGAIAFGIAKFAKDPMVKAACYGVIGVAIAKQLPVAKDGLA